MNQTDWVRPSWKTMLIGLALTAGSALSVAAEPATALHGAMPMQEQQQRLAQGRAVGLREALTKDASFWARLMPSPL
jgi:ATP-dependent protease ClpP protease subunit